MTNSLIVDKTEKIRIKRRALFDKGNIKLISIPWKRGEMVAIDPENASAVADAFEYNKLADMHRKMKQ